MAYFPSKATAPGDFIVAPTGEGGAFLIQTITDAHCHVQSDAHSSERDELRSSWILLGWQEVH